MSRVRSPNYPAIGLNTAIEKARAVHKSDGKNAVSREALAKLIGYGGLNGGSATMLSALSKYGLIESAGDGEARITDLAMRIIHADPHNPDEKRQALEEAALKPVIFSEIREKWPERPPGDETLRSFLARKGFTETALEQVIQFYHEIINIVWSSKSEQDSRMLNVKKEPMDGTSSQTSQPTPPAYAQPAPSAAAGYAPLGNKPFTIAFDGTVLSGTMAIRSVRDIERLMKVLQSQKGAFEAMQEADTDEGDG